MKAPEIIDIQPIKLVGICGPNNISQHTAAVYWQQFMPRRAEVKFAKNQELVSVSIYPRSLILEGFQENMIFEYWAAKEVTEFSEIPAGMQSYTIPAGKYAKFVHVGNMATWPQTMQFIYGVWMPVSGFTLDHRPHFEILGPKYKGPESPLSEEDVYIPIKPRIGQ